MPRPRHTVTKEFRLVDPETGEYRIWHQEVPVTRRRPGDKRTKRGDFVIIYLDPSYRLVGLTGTDRDVLDALSRRLGFNEPFRYAPSEIAEELGIPRPSVTRAVRHLRDRGLMIDLEHGASMLDPRIFWRGDAPEQEKWIARLEDDGLLVTITTPEQEDQPA